MRQLARLVLRPLVRRAPQTGGGRSLTVVVMHACVECNVVQLFIATQSC